MGSNGWVLKLVSVGGGGGGGVGAIHSQLDSIDDFAVAFAQGKYLL